MRPCWKPNSSPLRSDQGESRTPTPVKARRSERRVSASSTTWSSSPYGNRTHPSSSRGWRPDAARPTGHFFSSTGGNRTHKRSPRFELGRFADLRTVPASVPGGIRTRVLHRDRVASTPGCSTRTSSRASCLSSGGWSRTNIIEFRARCPTR
jgi:hypothetical protein